MNINPKDRRNYHGLTVEQKKQLFNAIHSVANKSKLDYYRMFTEPRKKGYRCKLWYGSMSDGWMEQVAVHIYDAIQKTPFGQYVSHVEAYRSKGSNYYRKNFNDPAFYIIFK